MSIVPKSIPMAECLNFGSVADNNDLKDYLQKEKEAMKEALYRDFLGFYMDFSRISDGEHKDVIKVNLKMNDQNLPECSRVCSAFNDCKDKLCELSTKDDDSLEKEKEVNNDTIDPEVPYNNSAVYFLPVNYNKRNPWRRIIGLHVYKHELRSATYPARSSVKKLRFAQAKKPLNYLYSYFSVEILDCDEKSSITIGICRKDYPSKVAPGKNSGSIGYNSDTGAVCICDSVYLDGPRFSKGDVVGCGIIYPAHYKRYIDLSTDDNSDGMSDIVLSSLLNTNTKSMNFVCATLNLNMAGNDSSSDSDLSSNEHGGTKCMVNEEEDYYNENYVESRTTVEIYFTHNMKVVGKVKTYVPVGGFYPTLHVFSCSPIKLNVDLNPPVS